jgi:RimJ/RimL family protein N-acetyltransferase
VTDAVAGQPRPSRGFPRGIPLPDPPLADAAAGIVLRPWQRDDAPALAAGWADAAVAAHTRVPADTSVTAAARWVAAEAERRRRGLALDLVIARAPAPAPASAPAPVPASPGDGLVVGEVGLAHFDDAGRAEVGFWVAPGARGRGVATAAVRLLLRWAQAPGPGGQGLGLAQLWARTTPGDERAAAVLARAGFERRGEAGGTTVWATPPAMLPA